MTTTTILVADVEAWLHRLFVGVDGTTLRNEARKKARELCGLLEELDRAVRACAGGSSRELTLIDAAAGKAYVGLLAGPLVSAPLGRRARIVVIEGEPIRLETARQASARVLESTPGVRFEWACGDVSDAALWPLAPDVVVALHACGEASDWVIARTVSTRAHHLLLAPCCINDSIPAARRARASANALGVPRHASVR